MPIRSELSPGKPGAEPPARAVVVLSPEEFRRVTKAASGKHSPAVQMLYAESAKRWGKVYEALAG